MLRFDVKTLIRVSGGLKGDIGGDIDFLMAFIQTRAFTLTPVHYMPFSLQLQVLGTLSHWRQKKKKDTCKNELKCVTWNKGSRVLTYSPM